MASDWWSLNKLESRYRKDGNLGFFEGEVQVDKLWIYSDEKIIKKMYTYLLEYELEDERVKETMIKWARDFG